MDPHVVDLTLTPIADGDAAVRAYAVSLSLPSGASHRGTARFDPGEVLTGDVTARALLDDFYAHTQRGLACRATLGRWMWTRLFVDSSPEIRAAWTEAETERRTGGRPLHLRAQVGGDDGLGELPIELLADGDGMVFTRPGNQLEIEHTGDGGAVARARRLVAAGRMLVDDEAMGLALACLREAIQLFDGANDRRGEAMARLALGELFSAWERPGEAGDAYLTALPMFETAGDTAGAAHAQRALGELYLRTGRWDDAATAFDAAAARYEAIGDTAGQADAAVGLGNLALLRGDAQQAFDKFRAAMQIHDGDRDTIGRAAALGYMARAAHRIGAKDRAAMLAAHAWAMFRESADEHGQRVALDDLTRILHDNDDDRGAVAAMFMAWVAARNLSEPSVVERADRLARAIDNFDPRRPSPTVYHELERVLFSSLAACQQVLEERDEDPRGPLPSPPDPAGD